MSYCFALALLLGCAKQLKVTDTDLPGIKRNRQCRPPFTCDCNIKNNWHFTTLILGYFGMYFLTVYIHMYSYIHSLHMIYIYIHMYTHIHIIFYLYCLQCKIYIYIYMHSIYNSCKKSRRSICFGNLRRCTSTISDPQLQILLNGKTVRYKDGP